MHSPAACTLDTLMDKAPEADANISPCRDLSLHGNRWRCDCRLLELRAWLADVVLPRGEPRCAEPPRAAGAPVRRLDVAEFACVPEVAPSTMYLEVIEGKNVSLVCTIKVRCQMSHAA